MAISDNYKPVLAFAAIIVGGVAIFGSSLSTNTKTPEENGVQSVESSDSPAAPIRRQASNPVSSEQPVIGDFTSDAELIDNASGFDPSPAPSLPASGPDANTQSSPAGPSSSNGNSSSVRIEEVQNIQEITE